MRPRDSIIAEGLDDLRALHEILGHQMGWSVERQATPWFDPHRERVFVCPGRQRTVHAVYTDGRDAAARLANDYLKEGKIVHRSIDRIGLVFDPDGHDDARWQHWPVHRALADLPHQALEDGYRIDLDSISVLGAGEHPAVAPAGDAAGRSRPDGRRSTDLM